MPPSEVPSVVLIMSVAVFVGRRLRAGAQGSAMTELDVRVRRVHERRCHPETLSVTVAWLPLSVRSREPEPLDWLSTFSDAW